MTKHIDMFGENRIICNKCGSPEGFCEHTIEKQYRLFCPPFPSTKKESWSLVRRHAMVLTEKSNLTSAWLQEKMEIKYKMSQLRKELDELRAFRNQVITICFEKLDQQEIIKLLKKIKGE